MMGLESADTIAELNPSWPTGSDPKSQGDDHLRLIKGVLQADALSLADGGVVEGDVVFAGMADFNSTLNFGQAVGLQVFLAPGSAAVPSLVFGAAGGSEDGISWASGAGMILTENGSRVGRLPNSATALVDADDYVKRAAGDGRYGRLTGPNTWTASQTLTGQLIARAGTSTPAITFAGEGDSGFASDGDVRVITGGSIRYTFEQDGSLQVATSVVNVANGDLRYAKLSAVAELVDALAVAGVLPAAVAGQIMDALTSGEA